MTCCIGSEIVAGRPRTFILLPKTHLVLVDAGSAQRTWRGSETLPMFTWAPAGPALSVDGRTWEPCPQR
jgi:hypothetical protein